MIRFIHAADFHLDSAFAALRPEQAASRRRESREIPRRLSNYVNQNGIDLVLLAGDLFDSSGFYRETGEQLAEALAEMTVPVLIAPGNHDWYGPGSPYQTVRWPENVRIFTSAAMEPAVFPRWNLTVHGAAFTSPEQDRSLLAGFSAPKDGGIHIGLLHGEIEAPEARYDSLRREEIAASGLNYLALGHVHKRSEPMRCGATLCAWPGCIEGRGFDELGEKGFYEGRIDDSGAVSLSFVPFARRRYEILEVDVTGKDPRAALEEALPEDTVSHLYRILLTGETGDAGANAAALQSAISDRFYALEVRDLTRPAEDLWARADEDTLRGLFLRSMRKRWDEASDDDARQTVAQAVRFGLAALDRRDPG